MESCKIKYGNNVNFLRLNSRIGDDIMVYLRCLNGPSVLGFTADYRLRTLFVYGVRCAIHSKKEPKILKGPPKA